MGGVTSQNWGESTSPEPNYLAVDIPKLIRSLEKFPGINWWKLAGFLCSVVLVISPRRQKVQVHKLQPLIYHNWDFIIEYVDHFNRIKARIVLKQKDLLSSDQMRACLNYTTLSVCIPKYNNNAIWHSIYQSGAIANKALFERYGIGSAFLTNQYQFESSSGES